MSTGTATGRAMTANEVSHEVIKAALKVYSALGPGLLEKAYCVCLAYELRKAGFNVETSLSISMFCT